MRKIGLGYLAINEAGKRYVLEAIENNRLSRGRLTTELEQEFARIHQAKYSVFCNSGTSALQIALAALREKHGYRDGDEVLVPALTFIASSNIILQNNLKPVFVEVDPRTFNMDPARIEEGITPKTRAIIPVHLFGLPCDMQPILEIARRHELQILEDSAETMFVNYRGRPVGSFGDLACFSTYVAHLLVGGVGGLVTGQDSGLEIMCRSLMAHGRDHIYLSIDDDDQVSDPKLRSIIERRYSFVRMGYSYRATELEAAIALSELEHWEQIIARRQENAALLGTLLKPIEEHVQLPYVPEGHEHAFMMYPMVARDAVDREALLLHLEQREIETRYMFPLLGQPYYRQIFPGLEDHYPVAKRLAQQGFFIGIHQGLTREDLEYVAEVMVNYFQNR